MLKGGRGIRAGFFVQDQHGTLVGAFAIGIIGTGKNGNDSALVVWIVLLRFVQGKFVMHLKAVFKRFVGPNQVPQRMTFQKILRNVRSKRHAGTPFVVDQSQFLVGRRIAPQHRLHQRFVVVVGVGHGFQLTPQVDGNLTIEADQIKVVARQTAVQQTGLTRLDRERQGRKEGSDVVVPQFVGRRVVVVRFLQFVAKSVRRRRHGIFVIAAHQIDLGRMRHFEQQ
mmetsp:Transcript_489/g.1378  ORF Transcript_489/g.1378 Transcript_489/m.1378 type:complete len:225 (+) Transcript_489:950-1624(+)